MRIRLPLYRLILTGLCCLLPLRAQASTLGQQVFTDLKGQPMQLDSLRGKIVLVNFWGTWCGPCRKEMPMLNQLSQQWPRHQLVVVGLALDQAPAVQKFVSQYQIGYRIVLAGDNGMALLPTLGNPASVVPFTVLLNRQGKPVQHWRGAVSASTLEQAIKRLR